MNDFGKYLKDLRGKRSLREMEKITGLSHTYLSTLEKGIDPRSKKERKPTPDVLKKLADSLSINYFDLMEKAGYIEEDDLYIIETSDGGELFTGGRAVEKRQESKLLHKRLNKIQIDPDEITANILPENDLIFHLNRNDITYLGNWLSIEDRMKVLKMMEELFPEKVNEFKNNN